MSANGRASGAPLHSPPGKTGATNSEARTYLEHLVMQLVAATGPCVARVTAVSAKVTTMTRGSLPRTLAARSLDHCSAETMVKTSSSPRSMSAAGGQHAARSQHRGHTQRPAVDAAMPPMNFKCILVLLNGISVPW
jgi:hypothetical protein